MTAPSVVFSFNLYASTTYAVARSESKNKSTCGLRVGFAGRRPDDFRRCPVATSASFPPALHGRGADPCRHRSARGQWCSLLHRRRTRRGRRPERSAVTPTGTRPGGLRDFVAAAFAVHRYFNSDNLSCPGGYRTVERMALVVRRFENVAQPYRSRNLFTTTVRKHWLSILKKITSGNTVRGGWLVTSNINTVWCCCKRRSPGKAVRQHWTNILAMKIVW